MLNVYMQRVPLFFQDPKAPVVFYTTLTVLEKGQLQNNQQSWKTLLNEFKFSPYYNTPSSQVFQCIIFIKRDYTYRVKNQEISPKRIQQSCETPIFSSFTVCVFITVEKHSLRRENSNQQQHRIVGSIPHNCIMGNLKY